MIAQHLRPDLTGWSNTLEDERHAWRVTPCVRWRTGGDISVYAQLGAGLYVHSVFGGDGFNTAEIGVVWRGRRTR